MAVFVNDTFTDTALTALGTHVGETGADWTEHGSYGPGDAVISDANRARADSTNASCYYADGVPASADYDVEALLRCVSALGQMGVVGRVNTAANTMYVARYNVTGTVWQLLKIVAGSATGLGSDYTDAAFTATVERTVKLRMVGDQINVYVDGTLRIGPITDSAITAAGKAGVRGQSGSNTTGYHLDSFTASDVASGPKPGTLGLLGVGR